jgi:hypothetical protein
MAWNFQGRRLPRGLQELPPNWKILSLLVMISPSEAPGARWDGAHQEISSGTYREGQFDVRSERAGPSPASEMTPRVAVLSSLTSTASSKDDCHDPFNIVAASAGNEIAVPGGITVASRLIVAPLVVSLTLGRVRGGNGFRNTTRTSNPISLHRNVNPTKSMSERAASAVCMMETASGPPRGLGVRTKRQVPPLVAVDIAL